MLFFPKFLWTTKKVLEKIPDHQMDFQSLNEEIDEKES